MKSGETLYLSLETEGFDGDDSLVESILGEPVDFRGRSVEECMVLVAKLIEKTPMVGTEELSEFELMGPEQVEDSVCKLARW